MFLKVGWGGGAGDANEVEGYNLCGKIRLSRLQGS